MTQALFSLRAWSWSRCSCASRSRTLVIALWWSFWRRLPALSSVWRGGDGKRWHVVIVLAITNSSLIPRSCGLKYFQYANMRRREGRRGWNFRSLLQSVIQHSLKLLICWFKPCEWLLCWPLQTVASSPDLVASSVWNTSSMQIWGEGRRGTKLYIHTSFSIYSYAVQYFSKAVNLVVLLLKPKKCMSVPVSASLVRFPPPFVMV